MVQGLIKGSGIVEAAGHGGDATYIPQRDVFINVVEFAKKWDRSVKSDTFQFPMGV